MKRLRTLSALFTLIGATIGIGVLALPYSFGQSGLIPSLLLLLLAFGLTLFLNLTYVEILLHVKGKHQLAGYAGKFFGNKGRVIAGIALLVGAYGACLAYIIQGGLFLHTILPFVSPFYFSLAFFLLISLVGLFDLRIFSTVQSVMVTILLVLILGLCLFGFPQIQISNYSLVGKSLEKILLPYGVLLFAFSGYSIIPEMGEITGYDRKKLTKSVIVGTTVICVVYLLFSLLVLGISGENVSEDAVTGMRIVFGESIIKIVAIAALLPVTTSYISLSRVTQDLFTKDLEFPKPMAWFLAIYPPLILFLNGKVGIVKVLEISGGVTVGLTGVLLIMMYLKMNSGKKITVPVFNKLYLYIVVVVFVAGVGYELMRGF